MTLKVAENPVALGAAFEFAARRFRILGAGEHRQQFIDGVNWRRFVVAIRERAQQLPLQDQVGVAADRRAQLRVKIQSDSGVIFRMQRQPRAHRRHIAAASLRLHAVDDRNPIRGGVASRDEIAQHHELRHQRAAGRRVVEHCDFHVVAVHADLRLAPLHEHCAGGPPSLTKLDRGRIQPRDGSGGVVGVAFPIRGCDRPGRSRAGA